MDKVVIYGLGKSCIKHQKALEKMYDIVGYCDADKEKSAALSAEKREKIILLEELAAKRLSGAFDYILITSSIYASEIIESLKRMGIEEEYIKVFAHEKEYNLLWGIEPLKGVSYSEGEDYLVDMLRDKLKISYGSMRYIELGVCDPVSGNNTYYFYKRGASGILVEANPDLIDNIARVRERDTIINKAVYAGDDTEVTFHISKSLGLSSLVRNHVEENKDWAEYPIVKEVTVPAIHINEVFELLGEGMCDLLSIDIEGYDLEALSALDFQRYRPKIMIVELNAGYPEKDGYYQRIVDLLTAEGYLLYMNDRYNGIFVDRKYRHMVE